MPTPVQKTALKLALALFGAASVAAQQAASTDSREVVTLERMVVTGSHLNAAADAAPVAVVTSVDLSDSGVGTNLLEALRKQLPVFSGGGNLGLSNAGTGVTGTYGGSKISLHNMPTLVLINGRRVATNGAAGRGGSSFVDLNQIPLSAVDRVEVLSEGASAIYGSDAMGGVVNIILKQDYNGSEVGGRYAASSEAGHYSEQSGWFTTGVSNHRISLVVSGNYSKTDPLMQDERTFGAVANTGSFSGVVGSAYLNSSYNSPREKNPTGTAATAAKMSDLVANGTYVSGSSALNLAPYLTMLMQQEQRSVTASFDAKLFDTRLEVFADALFSKNNSFSQLGAQGVTFGSSGLSAVPANSPYNPTRGSVSSVAFRYLPAPRQYRAQAELARFTGGLRGEISSSWNWEASYTGNRDKLTAKTSNVLYGPNLDLAVLGGYDANGNPVSGGKFSRVYKDYSAPALPSPLPAGYNASSWLASQRTNDNTVLQPALDPFARAADVDPASLANILGTSRADFTSNLNVASALVRGQLFPLPAGGADLAAGVDYRTEVLEGQPDTNSMNTGGTAQRWNGGTFFDPFDRSRHITSGYAELRAPVTGPKWKVPALHSLVLSAAYRVEDYSDYGYSRVPKYGASWQPLDDQVTLRYSWSKGFAAPNLYALYGPVTQGSTSNLSSYLGYNDTTSRQATLVSGSNLHLRPTTSKTRSVGMDLKPMFLKGLHVDIQYSDTDMNDLVGTAGAVTIVQSVEQFGPASPYAGQVAIGAAPGAAGAQAITAAGQLSSYLHAGGVPSSIFVADTKTNLSSAKLRVLDVSADYTWPTRDYGEFSAGTAGTFFIDDKIQTLPGEPYYEYAGLATANGTSSEGVIPPYRFYSTLGWRNSHWDLLLGNTYIPSVTDCAGGGSSFANSATQRRLTVGSYTTWDFGVGYSFALPKKWMAGFDTKFTVRVGVDNLANKMPPLSTQAFGVPTNPNTDTSTYSPIGRLYYVSAVLKF